MRKPTSGFRRHLIHRKTLPVAVAVITTTNITSQSRFVTAVSAVGTFSFLLFLLDFQVLLHPFSTQLLQFLDLRGLQFFPSDPCS